MISGMDQFTTLLGTGLGDNVVAMVVSLLYSLLSYLVSVVQANLWFTLLEVDWGDFNYTTIEGDFDAFDWDDFKNLIVCYFQSDGTITPADHLEALNEMEDHAGQIWRAIRLVWSLAGSIGISMATRWAGISDGDCEDCECILEDWDFTLSNGGFAGCVNFGNSNVPTYDSAGWTMLFNSTTYRGSIEKVGSFLGVTKIRIEVEYPDGSGHYLALRDECNEDAAIADWSDLGTGLNVREYTFPVATDLIGVSIYNGSNFAGAAVIKRIVLYC